MNFLKYILVLLIITTGISCNDELPEELDNLYFSKIIKTDKGMIRGVYLNEKIDQIKKREKNKAIVTETESILEYQYTLKEKGTYVVTYLFDNRGCYEIDVDLFLTSAEFVMEAKSTLKAYFDGKYDLPNEDESLWTWKNKQKTATIELDYLNEAEGEIMLTIFANE